MLIYGPNIRYSLNEWVVKLKLVDAREWVSDNLGIDNEMSDEEIYNLFMDNYDGGYIELVDFLNMLRDHANQEEMLHLISLIPQINLISGHIDSRSTRCSIGVIANVSSSNQEETVVAFSNVNHICTTYGLIDPTIYTGTVYQIDYSETNLPTDFSDSETNSERDPTDFSEERDPTYFSEDNLTEDPVDLTDDSTDTDNLSEEDFVDFSDITSDSESVSDDIQSCSNESVISLEPFDIHSEDVFTIYYLNNSNKFANGTCVSKSEMKDYVKSEEIDSPSLFTTIWKGGDNSGLGGKPTCKFIVKMPPNNVWVTLGSFDKMMNLNEKSWYLLPLYSNKRRRIGYQYGVSRNHGQIPGSKIYKAFTKQEIKTNVKVKETDEDYPLYLKDLTLDDLGKSMNIIKSIKNHFL